MPYKIFSAHNGFYVEDAKTKKRFSKHPLTKKNAIAQRQAIAISEAARKHKSVSHYFI